MEQRKQCSETDVTSPGLLPGEGPEPGSKKCWAQGHGGIQASGVWSCVLTCGTLCEEFFLNESMSRTKPLVTVQCSRKGSAVFWP